MICDQELVSAKDPPSHYLHKLKTYLDPKASRSSRKRKMVGESTSTQVLRDLEISLRTNHIEWVREFLGEQNHGLDVLVDYLTFRLMMLRHEQRVRESMDDDSGSENQSNSGGSNNRPSLDRLNSPRMKRASRHVQKLNMGDSKDDIHVCIMCMRAIMNNKYGFNLVFDHREAINCIALSLNHHSYRTKALVLELLAAICLVKGGHHMILNAFDNFKETCGDPHRFYTLMQYFSNPDCFHIEFMVSCMQFVNIVVHSVEDMNFRVHLQYEFSRLGLDEYLYRLRNTESEELHVQICAYLDNVFDVAALMEDSETKTAALERLHDTEEELAHTIERLRESEASWLAKSVELESELEELKRANQELRETNNQVLAEVTTLRRTATQREEENRQQQSKLEYKIQHLETLSRSGSSSPNSSTRSSTSRPSAAPVRLLSMAVPRLPPKPPPIGGIRGPPPMPGKGELHSMDAMTIKKKVATKYKLPTLNWVALKPNQVRGTVFNDLDDEKLFCVIDFAAFEEEFKIGPNVGLLLANGDSTEVDSLSAFGSKRFKKPELTSLMEHTRLRNVAISRRKLELSVETVTRAVNSLDLKTLHLDNVELLQRMVPTDTEIKAYREYERNKSPLHLLTEEDQYMFHLSKIDRLGTKLSLMSFLANFTDSLHCITPQIHAIITASRSVKNSSKLRRLLEVILAFGNYMNSSKRGPAYGFKLSSLDSLCDTKSAKKKISLLHYIQDTVRTKFPDLNNFEAELRGIEIAAQVSLENIVTDLTELDKGMESAKKEAERLKGHRSQEAQLATSILGDFLANSLDKLQKLKTELKMGQDAFAEALEYFGESTRSLAPNTFFSIFVRFCKALTGRLTRTTLSVARSRQRSVQQQLLHSSVMLPLPLLPQLLQTLLTPTSTPRATHAIISPRSRNLNFSIGPEALPVFQFKATQEKLQRKCTHPQRTYFASKESSGFPNRPALGCSSGKHNCIFFFQDTPVDLQLTSIASIKTAAVIGELRARGVVADRRLLSQEDVYHGALEDILIGLRNEPYRRADALRRSHRKRDVAVRLSRTSDDNLDF
ncbi:formin-like protein [Hyalella azteca]|uniref:Formin-like protein n=1 Tax=Hyalella azteca TaxID=294128 RepID=A0A979FWA1_HYAAZ|nr:formin-like protein [Hyalella azteca]